MLDDVNNGSTAKYQFYSLRLNQPDDDYGSTLLLDFPQYYYT